MLDTTLAAVAQLITQVAAEEVCKDLLYRFKDTLVAQARRFLQLAAENPAEAQSYAEQNHLPEQFAEAVDVISRETITLPKIINGAAHVHELATLFAGVLKQFCLLVRDLNADVLVPGSFLGSSSMTFLTAHTHSEVRLSNVTVSLSSGTLAMIPANVIARFGGIEKVSNDYTTGLRRLRKMNTIQRFPISKIMPSDQPWEAITSDHRVHVVTPAACFFSTPKILNATYGTSISESGECQLNDWPAGLDAMWRGLTQLRSLKILSDSEKQAIADARGRWQV